MASYFFLSSLQLKLKPLEGRGYTLGAPQWQIDGENIETVLDFIFLDSKINVDGNCSHEIKRRLLLGRIAMTNLNSVLKSRDITLLTNVHIVRAMEKAMAPYSSTLAWEIPWMEEPGRLQSMGSLRIGHE